MCLSVRARGQPHDTIHLIFHDGGLSLFTRCAPIQLGWLTRELQGLPCLYLPSTEVTCTHFCFLFLHSFRDSNSARYACMASTPPAELCPCPFSKLLKAIPLPRSHLFHESLLRGQAFNAMYYLKATEQLLGFTVWVKKKKHSMCYVTPTVILHFLVS